MPRRKHRAGAWLDAPSAAARTGWRLCWTDPETGRVRKMTLDPARYPNEAARNAVLESKSLSMRTAHLDRREGVISIPLDDALQRYLAAGHGTLRARTLSDYRKHATGFVAWCKDLGLQFARELTPGHLNAYRVDCISRPNMRATDKRRTPHAINNQLRAIATMVSSWRRFGWLQGLDSDAISDGLKQVAVVSEEVEILEPDSAQILLGAWLEHDRETYALTREENAGEREPGTTPRYPAIAPFFALVLLTGMRLSEALGLEWFDIELGHVIKIRASASKTKRRRVFDLTLSPGADAILRALSPGMVESDRVFPELRIDVVEAARKRLRKVRAKEHPEIQAIWSEWSWQTLRRTAASVYANLPSVGPLRESQLLGHSWQISERVYQGRVRVSPNAKTIDAALGLQRLLREVVRSIKHRG